MSSKDLTPLEQSIWTIVRAIVPHPDSEAGTAVVEALTTLAIRQARLRALRDNK